MKQLVFVMALFFFFTSNAQLGFNIIHDLGLPTNQIRDLVVKNDTILGYGMAYDTVTQQQGILLALFDSSGNYLSSNLILDPLGEPLSVDLAWGKVVATSDGGYAMTCATFFRKSTLLVKVDDELQVEFIKEYEDTVNLSNYFYRIEEISDGYLLYGGIQRPNILDDAFIRKVDKQGNTVWFDYFGPFNLEDVFVDLKKTSDTTFIAASVETINSNSGRSTLRIFDLDGNLLKSWISGPNPEIGFLRKIIPIAGGGGYITYGVYVIEITPNGTYMVQSTLARLSADFDLLWVEHFGEIAPLGRIGFWDIEQTLDGYYVAAGESNIFFPGQPDFSTGWLLKFTEYGDMLWERQDMGPYPEHYLNNHYFGGVGVLSSGNIVAGGTARKDNKQNIWLVKVTTDGCMDTILCEPITGIVEQAKKEAAEMKVYPNPATESVTVELPPGAGQGEILLHNLRGGLVLREVFNNADQCSLDVSGLTAGVYFLKVCRKNGDILYRQIVVVQG